MLEAGAVVEVREDEDGVPLGAEPSGLASPAVQPTSGSSASITPAAHRRLIIAKVLAGSANHAPTRD